MRGLCKIILFASVYIISLKMFTAFNPVRIFLETNLKEIIRNSPKDACTKMIIAMLFTIKLETP